MTQQSSNQRLLGKVAIVTGAAQGMGRAIALLFAEHGASVVVNDLSQAGVEAVAQEIKALGRTALPVIGDVTRPADVKRLVQDAVTTLGSVDILVNNAGVLRPGPTERIDEAEWDLVVDVTMKGAFLCSQAVIPIFKAKRSGKIVNMASLAGRATSTLGGAHYTAAKAGMLGLSRHLARELAPFHVNVNAVCPGVIDTPMAHAFTPPERLDEIRQGIPFKRLGRPEDVAALVLFLASEDSSYITGAAVDIHGGELII